MLRQQVKSISEAMEAMQLTCHLRHCGLNDGLPRRAPAASVKIYNRFPFCLRRGRCGRSFGGYVIRGNLSNIRLIGPGTAKRRRGKDEVEGAALDVEASRSGIARPAPSSSIGDIAGDAVFTVHQLCGSRSSPGGRHSAMAGQASQKLGTLLRADWQPTRRILIGQYRISASAASAVSPLTVVNPRYCGLSPLSNIRDTEPEL